MVGLGNCHNTTDAAKLVSDDTLVALNAKADLDSTIFVINISTPIFKAAPNYDYLHIEAGRWGIVVDDVENTRVVDVNSDVKMFYSPIALLNGISFQDHPSGLIIADISGLATTLSDKAIQNYVYSKSEITTILDNYVLTSGAGNVMIDRCPSNTYIVIGNVWTDKCNS